MNTITVTISTQLDSINEVDEAQSIIDTIQLFINKKRQKIIDDDIQWKLEKQNKNAKVSKKKKNEICGPILP